MWFKSKEFLEKGLVLFYVGNERNAGQILANQRENLTRDAVFNAAKKMVILAEELKNSLNAEKTANFGEILHHGWLLKKKLADNISNPVLDENYEEGLKNGAVGGKLLGAGSGVFFLFYCEPENQPRLRKALKLREMEFKFEDEGSNLLLDLRWR